MTQPLFDLTGRVAVVTGASSGIGQAIAGFLAKAGARIVLLARRQDRLDQTVTTIEAAGGEAAAVGGDLAEREQIPAIATKCREMFGHPHILVNAAGINLRQVAEDVTTHSWDQTIQLNLSAPFFLARELAGGMKKQAMGASLISRHCSRPAPFPAV